MKMIDFPEISSPIQGLEEVTLPRMARVRQLYALVRGYDPDETRRRVAASLAEALAAVSPEWPGTLLITGGDTISLGE